MWKSGQALATGTGRISLLLGDADACKAGPDCLLMVYQCTLAASSSLAWPLVDWLFAHCAPAQTRCILLPGLTRRPLVRSTASRFVPDTTGSYPLTTSKTLSPFQLSGKWDAVSRPCCYPLTTCKMLGVEPERGRRVRATALLLPTHYFEHAAMAVERQRGYRGRATALLSGERHRPRARACRVPLRHRRRRARNLRAHH